MTTLEEFFKPLIDAIIQVPNFAEIGIFIIFGLSIIPFMPIPPEPIVIPLALAVDDPVSFVWSVAILISVGAFISHVIVFYLAREHLHRIGIRKKSKLSKSHWFHKYGVYTMLIVPSISIVIPPLIDSTMIVLGHYRANHMRLFAVIFAGEMIRAFITGTMLITLLSL